jgi:hypothetical protein
MKFKWPRNRLSFTCRNQPKTRMPKSVSFWDFVALCRFLWLFTLPSRTKVRMSVDE